MTRRMATCGLVVLGAAAVLWAAPEVHHSQRTTQEQVDAGKAAAAYTALRSGLEALSQGRQQEAQQHLEQAARLLPWWPEPHNLLAFFYQRQGDTKRARQEYEAALRGDPGNIHARAALATLTPETPAGSEIAAASTQEHGTETAQQERRELEDYLVELINQERVSRGLVPLQIDDHLRTMARAHAEEMRDLGYFDHVSPVRQNANLLDRCLQCCPQRPALLAENISRRWGYGNCLNRANLQKSHQGLMASAGHRANILNPQLTDIGVGIAVNAQGDYWITENFARFRD